MINENSSSEIELQLVKSITKSKSYTVKEKLTIVNMLSECIYNIVEASQQLEINKKCGLSWRNNEI